MVTELFEINKQTDKLKKVVEEDQKSIEALSNELDKCEIVFFPLCYILKVLVITCFLRIETVLVCAHMFNFCAEFIKK